MNTDASRPIDEEVAEVLALDEKRTPGEWDAYVLGKPSVGSVDRGAICMMSVRKVNAQQPRSKSDAENDARFIAAAPRMAALIRRMAEEREVPRNPWCRVSVITPANGMPPYLELRLLATGDRFLLSEDIQVSHYPARAQTLMERIPRILEGLAASVPDALAQPQQQEKL